MSVAGHYGRRLLLDGRNIETKELDFIMSEYPSHDFAIDRKEVGILFKNVRKPRKAENLLAKKSGNTACWPDKPELGEQPPFNFLSTELSTAESEHSREQSGEDYDAKLGNAARDGLGDAVEAAREQSTESNGKKDIVTDLDAARGICGSGRNSN